MAIFITGLPGCGKSTLIQKIVERARVKGVKISGFITPEIRINDKRIGFKIINLATGEEGILASEENKNNSKRFGRYFVHINQFESIALKDVFEGEIIIIDEIGKMELLSEKFRKLLRYLKERDNVIATVHRSIAKNFNAIDITNLSTKDKEYLAEKILNSLLNK